MKVKKIVWVLCAAALLAGGCGQSESRSAKKGLKAIKQQRYDDAVEQFSALIEKYPEHEDQAVWNNHLGIALWQLNRSEEANNAFHRSRELNPDYFEPAYNLGVLFMRAGDLYQGATLLEDAALIREEGTLALEMLAAEYLKQSEWGKARDVLQKAQKRAPESPRVLTYLAMAGLHDEGAGFTESYLDRALELDPRYAPALFNLGILYEKWHKQPEKAVEYYDQYMAVERDQVRRSLVKHTVDKLKASIEPVVQTPKEAEPTHNPMQPVVKKQEEPVVKEDPNADPVEREVDGLLALAVKELRGGSLDRSLNYCLQAAAVASSRNRSDLQLKALKSAVSLNPEQGRSHFALGRFYHEQKDYKNAVESFSQAVKYIPEWPAGLLALAESASAGHEYQTALSALRKAVRADMGNADSLWALAKFYDNDLKLPERALEHYRLFAQRFPEDKRSNSAVSLVEKLERADESNVGFDAPAKPAKPKEKTHTLTAVTPVAVSTVEKVPSPRPGFRTLTPKVVKDNEEAAAVSPKETMAVTRDGRRVRTKAIDLFNRGTVYQKSNQFEQAIALYGQSIKTDGTYAPAHYNLGVILQRQNKLQGAIDAYKEALRIKPNLVNARYNLGFIYKDLQQYEKAIKELNSVLKENRNHAPSFYALGLIYSSRGNVQLAKFNYENFIRLAPTDPAAPRVKRWISMH